jgi:hypothetical protein
LYYSIEIVVLVIKSGKTRWVGHVAFIGETRNPYKVFFSCNTNMDMRYAYNILVGKFEGKRDS